VRFGEGEFFFYIFKRSKHTIMKLFISFILLASWGFSQVTDIDGNTYKIVKIGTQTWFAEDLKVTRFNNGDEIPDYTANWTYNTGKILDDSYLIKNLPAMCYYNNNKNNPLYSPYVTISNRNVCPNGYKVPSTRDYLILIDYLGGLEKAGIALKSADGWEHAGNNSSGFNLKGRGMRYGSGEFDNKYNSTYLLTKSIEKKINSNNDFIYYHPVIFATFSEDYYEKKPTKIDSQFAAVVAGTIRCIKD